MMIACLYLDDMIVIPGGRLTGDVSRADLRECVFRASDGWTLTEVTPGRFEIRAPWLDGAVVVGGYGYSYTLAPDAPAVVTPIAIAAGKGKRH